MSQPPAELGYAAAFTMGLLGSVHCVVMCGGVVGALSQALPVSGEGAGRVAIHLLQQLVMSLGRITTYAVFGVIAGAAGMVVGDAIGSTGAVVFRVAFGLLMVAAGLYIAGWWSALGRLEHVGTGAWRRLSPVIASLQPADRLWKQLVLGAIWGWLPCGLVYAALAGAVTTGSAGEGGALMFSFGLGTLPALLATGLVSQQIGRFARSPGTRRMAGMLLVLFGVWTGAGALMPHGSGEGADAHHHHHDPGPSPEAGPPTR
jgi:sulfite exporter TauE/SafE